MQADPAALTALQPSLFYAWRADRPAGAWYYALSAAAVAGVLLLTLFPLAPQWARVAVLYALLGLLSTLLGAVALRYVVFVAVWVATGWHLWLLPNLMSDTVRDWRSVAVRFTNALAFLSISLQVNNSSLCTTNPPFRKQQVPITEVLSPPVSFERGAGPATARHYGARAATLAAVVGAAFALARTAPDARSVRKGVSDAHFTLLEYFDLHSARDALGGNNGTGAANATAGAGGRKAGAPAGQPRWQQQHQQQQQRAHQQQQQRAQQQASRAAQKGREEDDGEEEVIDLGAAGGAGSEQQQQGRQQQRASSSKAEGGERGGDEL